MVKDSLWEDTFRDTDTNVENICIGCLERRIGRRLSKEDFTDYPINDLSINWVRTERLIDRLSN